MIHFTEDNKLEMMGKCGELLAESSIISVNVIKTMISSGLSKDFAIKRYYESLEDTIKIYESDGYL